MEINNVKYADFKFNLESLFDPSIIIETAEISQQNNLIGSLESQLKLYGDSPASLTISPIVKYVAVLKNLRNKSQKIASAFDEINFSHTVKTAFKELAHELDLREEHFSIDTSGAPLLIKESSGEHLISPTHFENGAYFSHPHADHHLELPAKDLPKIQIGKYTRFGKGASANAGGNLIIGNGVWLSPGSCLLKQDHDPYGRPSLFSRTVSMTRLPSIHVADFAWIGREAMVGWDADYIGTCAIVATRSFVNSWVGDYSITGSYGKVIQYLPYKAAAIELMHMDMQDILRIADWEAVNRQWLMAFNEFHKEYRSIQIPDCVKQAIMSLNKKGSKILDTNPGVGDIMLFACNNDYLIDGIVSDKKLSPYILQRIQNVSKLNARIKNSISNILPVADADFNPFNNKKSGYDLVLNLGLNMQRQEKNSILNILIEACRVANIGAKIIFGSIDEYDFTDLIAASAILKLKYMKQNIEKNEHGNRQHFIEFLKT